MRLFLSNDFVCVFVFCLSQTKANRCVMSRIVKSESFLQVCMRKARDFVHVDSNEDLTTFAPIINRVGITFIDWLQSDAPAIRLFIYRTIAHQFHRNRDLDSQAGVARNRLIVTDDPQFKQTKVLVMDSLSIFNGLHLERVLQMFQPNQCVACIHKSSDAKADESTEQTNDKLKSIEIVRECDDFRFWLTFQYYFEYQILSWSRLRLVLLLVSDENFPLITCFLKTRSYPFHIVIVTYKFQLNQLLSISNVSFYRIKAWIHSKDSKSARVPPNVIVCSINTQESSLSSNNWIFIQEICYDQHNAQTFAIPF